MKTLRRKLRVVVIFTAILAALAAPGLARAGWQELTGTYTGPWKSTDTDGKSYSGKATVKVVSGPGNKVTVTMKTALFGNPINAIVKSKSNGSGTYVVSNPILGTVTGDGKATASGKKGRLTGTAVLYVVGTTSLDATLQSSKGGLSAKGTLARVFPFSSSKLTFTFSGKKK